MRSQRYVPSHQSKSWTDDLPVCKQSGVGFSTNQVYREDGNRQEEHSFEDRNFHTKFDAENLFLYGIFDGNEGQRAVDFCVQRMPAELLFGQLNPSMSDEEIKDALRQAFLSVEKSYMDSVLDLLALRASFDIPEVATFFKESQEVMGINSELSSGTAVAIALIYNGKLYVANVGNCRVLLCYTDTNYVLRVKQLTVDHDLKNEDELLRLSQFGINVDKMRESCVIGNQSATRCLGNYLIKGEYKDMQDLAMATHEPIIAEPDIVGGIPIEDSHRFLLLMSAGLYKCVEETKTTDQTNQYIAQCVVEQFRVQGTLNGVAQSVVDKVARLHHDSYVTDSFTNDGMKREDITLIVRNFNYPMPNAKSPTVPSITFNPIVSSTVLSAHSTLTDTYTTAGSAHNGTSSVSTAKAQKVAAPNERIKSYVDCNEFYKYVKLAKAKGTLPDGLDL